MDGTNPAAGSNESTASVSFEVDPKLRNTCAKAGTDAITMYNTRAECGPEIIGFENVIGLEWEPQCIYVVIAADNQAQIFDEMMAAGRIMSDPFNVSVKYTVGLAANPDVTSAAINCQSSFMLQENYARDKILQDELQELEEKRALYQVYTDLIAFWSHVLKMSTPFATRPRAHVLSSRARRLWCCRKVQAAS